LQSLITSVPFSSLLKWLRNSTSEAAIPMRCALNWSEVRSIERFLHAFTRHARRFLRLA
jgi:hypothetical protein